MNDAATAQELAHLALEGDRRALDALVRVMHRDIYRVAITIST